MILPISPSPRFGGTLFIETTGMTKPQHQKLNQLIKDTRKATKPKGYKAYAYTHTVLLGEFMNSAMQRIQDLINKNGKNSRYSGMMEQFEQKAMALGELSDASSKAKAEVERDQHDFLILRTSARDQWSNFDQHLVKKLQAKGIAANWMGDSLSYRNSIGRKKFDWKKVAEYCNERLFIADNVILSEDTGQLARLTRSGNAPLFSQDA